MLHHQNLCRIGRQIGELWGWSWGERELCSLRRNLFHSEQRCFHTIRTTADILVRVPIR